MNANRPQEHFGSDRRLIRDAMIATVADRGYSATDLDAVLAKAGVERKAFDRHFSSLEECFVGIWEGLKSEVIERTRSAFESKTRWRDGMRAAAWALARYLYEDHDRARCFIVEVNYVNDEVQASRDVTMREYIELIDRGNSERRESTSVVALEQAEALMGAIWQGAAALVRANDFETLPTVVPQAMYVTVLPYLGVTAAHEELVRGPDDLARFERGEL